jgi:predicted ATP-dependent Lon-type protease
VHNKQVEGVQGVKDDDPEGMTKLAAVWSGAAADYGKLDVKTAEVKAITGKMQAGSTAVSVALASPAHGGDAVKAAVEQYNKAATELQTFCGVEDKK